ncbi:MAG: hypothetical protein NC334_03500 [Bacteroides sp.]|nr:hypothetical protein [Bacteroides sp.]
MRIDNLQPNILPKSYPRERAVQNSPAFGIANSGKLKNLFSYGLPCMYTGVEMIDPRRVQRLLNNNAFDAPVSEVMQTMKPFEKSITDIEYQVYKIIKSVARLHPEKNLQQILKIITPSYSAKLKKEQLPVLEQIRIAASDLPEDYQYRFQHFMSETEDKINEKPIYLPFSSYEFKYKLDKIGEDIVQNGSPKAQRVISKLRLEASRLTDETDSKTMETQQQIMKFLKIILKSSVLKKNEQLRTLIGESQKRLKHERFLVPFSRKSFIYDLNNLIEPIEDEELKTRLQQLAISLPTSRKSIPAYIMKFSREPSWKIGYRLLWPNLASVEHILPQSKGGADEMYNFGGAGTRVNAERGNIDFTEQLVRVPETSENSQKYVDGLINQVKRGIFRKNNVSTSYVDEFCKTVQEQSCGQVNLNIAELQEHRYKGSVLLNILESLNLH